MARPQHKPTRRQPVEVVIMAPAGVSHQTLRGWAKADRRRLPTLSGPVIVATVSPATSRQLNRRYRQKNRPTNVLSFNHSAKRRVPSPTVAGEIILCPAVIRREARQQQRLYQPYLHFLLQHGLLHLLGLDHQTVVEQRRWDRWAKRFSV